MILLGGSLALVGALGAAVVFGGVISVSATEPEPAALQWLLSTTMKNSVENHASDIVVPADVDLRDPALAERAFGHFSVACTPCHGGPGIEPAPWLVLDPPAKSLADTAEEWKDNELYWIVKHGIQMTGMPALGPTHQDADLWAIAAFVRQLPDMTAEQYQQMAARHAATHAGHMDHGMPSHAAASPVEPPAAPIEAAREPAPIEAARAEAPTDDAPASAPTAARATKAKRRAPAPPRERRAWV